MQNVNFTMPSKAMRFLEEKKSEREKYDNRKNFNVFLKHITIITIKKLLKWNTFKFNPSKYYNPLQWKKWHIKHFCFLKYHPLQNDEKMLMKVFCYIVI